MEELEPIFEDMPVERQHERIDELERRMLEGPVIDLPLKHRFTPGLYAREIFMPAGTLCTSLMHKTEHPYVVLSGRAQVYIPGKGWQLLEAGTVGVTKPGTRRVLFIEEDCRWITFHPTTETDLAKLEEQLIERREVEEGRTMRDLWLAKLDAQRQGELPPPAPQLDYGGAP